MEDVKWSEFIAGGLAAILLVVVSGGLVSLVVSSLFDVSTAYGIDTFSLGLISAGLIGSVLVARVHPGPDSLLEHGWLFAVVFIGLPALLGGLSFAGALPSEFALDLSVRICQSLSMILFAFVFIQFLHAKNSKTTPGMR